MSIKISGILPGPTGEPAAHIGITLRAVKTSLTVITTLESNSITGTDGAYSLNVEPGQYDVLLWVDGINARNVGTINVYSDSLPGTLNNFLTALREEDGTPEIIRQLEQLRAEALQSALEAKASKEEATHQAGIATNAAENAAQETADFITAVVKDDADRAEAARKGAETAQSTVNTMADEIVQHHTDVGKLASAASDSAAAAAGSSNSAAQSASESEGSKNAATRSEQGAASSALSAGNSAIAAAGDKAAAEAFRDEAEEFAARAKVSAESIDVSALEEQINEKVSQVVFEEAISGKASNQALTDGLAAKASNNDLMDGLSDKAAKGANNDITELNTLTKPIAIAQGGSGSKTAAEARSAFGLGSAATLSSGKAFGNLLPIGTSFSAQLAGDRPSVFISSAVPHFSSAISTTAAAIEIQNGGNTYAAACMMFHRVAQHAVFFGLSTNNRLAFGGYSAGPYQYDLITQQNSTVDSNGFYKAASPVIKLFGDGTSETNPESEGAISERISKGVYKISGVLGFNSDESWGGPDGGIEIPLDKNKQALIWVDYKVTADGDLLIKTYHRTHPSSPVFARNIIDGYEDGQPIDIPTGRFVDLRIQMPEAEKTLDTDALRKAE